MVRNRLIQILLLPLSLLYGAIMALRNLFYQKGILKSISFSIPVISIGNLAVGGTGKSPHIEYLVHFLSQYLEVATLSRGYKRKTKGYLKVVDHHSAIEVGDEPLQFRRKFHSDIHVAVDENRVFGIPKILKDKPNTQVILLDDAYQHRALTPGLNILLTEYSRPFTHDFLLPSGRLREWRSAYKRADVIMVTKCPTDLTIEKANAMHRDIAPMDHQKVFFSHYAYGDLYSIINPIEKLNLASIENVLLISAIANVDYLIQHLEKQFNYIKTLEFEDHHLFDHADISTLLRTYSNMPKETVIITTEKDAVRLELHKAHFIEQGINIYAIPVEVQIHFEAEGQFRQHIIDYLLSFKS